MKICKVDPKLIELGTMLDKEHIVYVYMGEFDHAPGHSMLMNWDTKEITFMHDISNYVFLDQHPSDIAILLD